MLDVLVCAHNEEANIPRLFASLREQSSGPRAFRVIVVDNASRDGTREMIRRHGDGLELVCVYEPRLGLNHARNTGYRHATAAYVAHLDADARAQRRWIETITEVVRRERPDLCGGPYRPEHDSPRPVWFRDRYNSLDQGPRARTLEDGAYLSGTNMIWRRAVVERLGGFRSDVGLVGRGLARGDETQLMVRARRELPGFKVYYHPGIVVYHRTRPETDSLWYHVRRAFAGGRHHNNVWGIGSHDRSRPWLARRFARCAAVGAARFAGACLVRDRRVYPYWQNWVYEECLPEIYRLGRLWEAVTGWKSAPA